MGRNIANSLSKVTADYDESPQGASASPQETVVALPSLQPVCHWGFDSPGRVEQLVLSKGCKDSLSQSGKGMLGKCLKVAKATPLLPGLRGTFNDEIPCN